MATSELRTEAWLLRGISSIPGELHLRGGLLRFVALGTGSAWPWQLSKLERLLQAPGYAASAREGKRFTLFTWPVSEVGVVVPWYYFGGGIQLMGRGQCLRISFGAPADTSPHPAIAVDNLNEVGAMRSRGRRWQEALAKASRE